MNYKYSGIKWTEQDHTCKKTSRHVQDPWRGRYTTHKKTNSTNGSTDDDNNTSSKLVNGCPRNCSCARKKMVTLQLEF